MNSIIKSTLEHVANMKDLEFQGYHKFRAKDGSEYGSFEVFYETGSDPLVKSGWYWWSCFPGCIPDGDQNGPFPTAEGAYLDAMEGSGSSDDENDGQFEQREAYLERLADDISPNEEA